MKNITDWIQNIILILSVSACYIIVLYAADSSFGNFIKHTKIHGQILNDFSEKNYQQSLKSTKSLLKKIPGNINLLIDKSILQLYLGEADKAIIGFIALSSKYPLNRKIILGLRRAYLLSAVKSFKKGKYLYSKMQARQAEFIPISLSKKHIIQYKKYLRDDSGNRELIRSLLKIPDLKEQPVPATVISKVNINMNLNTEITHSSADQFKNFIAQISKFLLIPLAFIIMTRLFANGKSIRKKKLISDYSFHYLKQVFKDLNFIYLLFYICLLSVMVFLFGQLRTFPLTLALLGISLPLSIFLMTYMFIVSGNSPVKNPGKLIGLLSGVKNSNILIFIYYAVSIVSIFIYSITFSDLITLGILVTLNNLPLMLLSSLALAKAILAGKKDSIRPDISVNLKLNIGKKKKFKNPFRKYPKTKTGGTNLNQLTTKIRKDYD